MTPPNVSVDNRVQVLDRPIAAPGHCAICGFAGGFETDGRKFIDWGFSLDFFGAVIICSICIEHVANLLGYLSPEQAKNLKEENNLLLGAVQDLETENAKLRSALNALGSLRDIGNLSDVPSLPEIVQGNDEGKGSDDSGSDESDSGGGPEVIPDPKPNVRAKSAKLIDL